MLNQNHAKQQINHLYAVKIVNTKTFENYQTKRTFKILHKLNCKCSFMIYLMECTLCKIQYVGKAEKPFNIRLNKHRKDANSNNPKAIPVSIHFKQAGHNFSKQATLTLTEQLNNTINTDIDTIKIRLKRGEDFSMLKPDALTPKGLNNLIRKYQAQHKSDAI